MTEQQEREAFEAWVTSPPIEAAAIRWSSDTEATGWPGQYMSYQTQCMWEAWNASAEWHVRQTEDRP